MTTSVMLWLLSTRGLLPVVIAAWMSIAATELADAQSAPANAPAGDNAAPPAASPNDTAASEVADWRAQMVDRINRNTAFPVRGRCREGLVKILFSIDRAGNLLASEIAESSNIPAFDVEALEIIKRAHPFPAPPKAVGGARVTLRVPVRFKQPLPDVADERRLYLNLAADSTLTLDGLPVEKKALGRAVHSAANNDKSARIVICSDENVPPAELSDLVKRVKDTGVKFSVVPQSDPASD
jgi:TonB family protein